MAKEKFTLLVNGRKYTVTVEPDEPLLWVLRDDLGLTGTKFGCGVGECGACAVIIDGVARRSCQVLVKYISSGQQITTIEGLGTLNKLTPLQQSFIEHTAFGCGFCTPGMIMSSVGLLKRKPPFMSPMSLSTIRSRVKLTEWVFAFWMMAARSVYSNPAAKL